MAVLLADTIKLNLSEDHNPFRFDVVEFFNDERPVGFRFSNHCTTVQASLFGHKIVVCGEDDDLDISRQKAISELYERAALLSFGPGLKISSSNGWAAHKDSISAKTNATLELIERDSVLAQWYTKTPFCQVRNETLPANILNWVRRELVFSEFPILKVLVATRGIGPAVVCLLMNQDGYGVSAHATKLTLAESVESAITEACRAAHLFVRRSFMKDTIKLKNNVPGPVEPSAHSLYYAYQEPFPEWMFGEFTSFSNLDRSWKSIIDHCLTDHNFHYHELITKPRYIGFVNHPSILHPYWGSFDLNNFKKLEPFKRQFIKLETINAKPHIVS